MIQAEPLFLIEIFGFPFPPLVELGYMYITSGILIQLC